MRLQYFTKGWVITEDENGERLLNLSSFYSITSKVAYPVLDEEQSPFYIEFVLKSEVDPHSNGQQKSFRFEYEQESELEEAFNIIKAALTTS